MNKMHDAINIIALNVRKRRILKKISQEELADKCKLHRTYIGSIERKERNITITTLFRIAEALDCKAEDLLNGLYDE